MSSKVMVLVGTAKGGFVFSSDEARQDWQVSDIHFKSWKVMHMQLDPRDQRLHAMDYLEYAYLQSGRTKEAEAVAREMAALPPIPLP